VKASNLVAKLADDLSEVVFRSVEIRRRGADPDGPTLILANHGGGLADILLVIAATTRFPRFLARDVIWRVPGGPAIMRAVGGIPVHRRQDHGGTADNTGMFDAAFDALGAGATVAIYPEGESTPEPRLAPLRTGAARIALGALARGVDTAIVPTGLHYFDVSVLRARAMVDIAVPVMMSEVVAGLGAHGAVSESNHNLVQAVTAEFTTRLAAVTDEYSDWEERHRYEVAATVYLQDRQGQPAPIRYSEIALLARRIGEAPLPQRAAVDLATGAFLANTELLGVRDGAIPESAMVGTRLAGELTRVALLAPLATYGFVVNGVGILGLRAISRTGMAPATAASVKPAVAVIAFPLGWAALSWFAYRRGGPLAAVAAGLSGPVSLAAAVAAGERAQLLFIAGRALRRVRGPLLGQVATARENVTAAVQDLLDAPPA
jgi:hypothetical protein